MNVYNLVDNGYYKVDQNTSNLPGTTYDGILELYGDDTVKYLRYTEFVSGSNSVYVNYYNGSSYQGWTQIQGIGTGGAGAETDPVFTQWLSDTPPAYPGDIPSIVGLLDETAHDLLDHSGLTGIPNDGYTTTATAAGTTTLNVNSNLNQFFTGTTTQTIVMPVTSTLTLGRKFRTYNASTGILTVNSSGGNLIAYVNAKEAIELTCIAITGTGAASWSYKGIESRIEFIEVACSDITTSNTATTNVASFHMPFAGTLLEVISSLDTVCTGSTHITDINYDGSTCLSTKLSIDASEYDSSTAASAAVISVSAFAKDKKISIDRDQVGATIPGKGHIVSMKFLRD